jgi:hypothetical protein
VAVAEEDARLVTVMGVEAALDVVGPGTAGGGSDPPQARGTAKGTEATTARSASAERGMRRPPDQERERVE